MDSKNRTAPVRFGVMGPGRAAVRFAQGLAGVEGATLTGVWGRNAERARSFAERFAVPFSAASVRDAFANIAALSDDEVDALRARGAATSRARFSEDVIAQQVVELVESFPERQASRR